MGMISFSQTGDFSKTTKFLEKAKEITRSSTFDKYGRLGVEALAAATPKDTGLTAASWSYEIERSGDEVKINWLNSNSNNGVVIAVILQYGHGTGTGGYVKGTDYINPAMKNIFENLLNDLWKEVTK